MVKKLKQIANDKAVTTRPSLFDNALAAQVKDSAQQIWLAGMGAYSRAQAEGTKVFETLVKEGQTLQKKTQSDAKERLSDVTSKMSGMAGDVQAKAGQSWDKLESIFEDRTAKALGKLGVPSAKELQALVARIDELSAKVAKLSKPAPVKAAAAAPKNAASASTNGTAKPAGKRAAARKAAESESIVA
jgi:poly(hydroxyalkanoate) granule-associated protein